MVERRNPYAGIMGSLGYTESGNNYNADNNLGYTGKYQFGKARLKDLGMGRTFTYENYLKSPELQEAIMERHLADIDAYAANNDLLQYEGQTIGGVPINRDAMRAMAHLGGNYGMAQFLRTGGKYNPSDDFGTSLSDYARTHGRVGPTRARAAGHNPETYEGADATRALSSGNFLRDYANERKLTSDMMLQRALDVAEDLSAREKDVYSYFAPDAMPPEEQQPPQRPQPRPQNLTGFGSATPIIAPEPTQSMVPLMFQDEATSPTIGEGEATRPSMMDNEAEPVVSSMRPQPRPSSVMDDDPQDVGDMAAAQSGDRTLLDDPEDDEAETERKAERRRLLGEMLTGLGVGLSQMSGGSNVDLTGVWSQADNLELANRQEDRLDREQKLKALEAVQVNQPPSRQVIDMISQIDPTGGLAAAYISGNEDERSTILDIAKSGYQENLKDSGDSTDDEAFARAAAVWLDPNASQQAKTEALLVNGIEGTDAKRLFDMAPSSNKPTVEQLADRAWQLDQELPPDQRQYGNKRDAFRDVGRMTGGIEDQASRTMVDQRIDVGTTMEETLQLAAQTAQESLNSLSRVEEANRRLIEHGTETGVLTPLIDWATSAAESIPGFSGIAEYVSEQSGIPLDAIKTIGDEEQALAFALARANSGQGTISDREREAMLRQVVNQRQSVQSRENMLAKMKALALIDQAAYQHFAQNVDPEYQNSIQMRREVNSMMLEAATPVMNAHINQRKLLLSHSSAIDIPGFENLSPEEARKKVIPRLSSKTAQTFASALPVKVYIDKDTDKIMAWDETTQQWEEVD